MSYILDALKKIEREKSKKLPGGRVNISGDLFMERKQPKSSRGIWKIAALVLLASLVTCGGTWLVLQGKGKKSRYVSALPSVPQAPFMLQPQPVTAMPVPAQAVPAAVPAAAPAVAAPPAVSVASAGKASSGVADAASGGVGRAKGQPAKEAKTAPKSSVPTVPAPADIKLSGIAWQDERATRRAVINGFLLKEGAVVSGAKIIEIKADRVNFSSSAGRFEIKLDAVLPSEARQ